MRFYRVCVIDTTDRIEDMRLVEAANDQQALQAAQVDAAPDTFLEVWDQRRLVGRVVSQPSAAILPAVIAADELSLAT